MSAQIAMAAARGILRSLQSLGVMWNSIDKATTAKSKASEANISQLKKMFLNDVVATVNMEEFPAELILN